MANEEQLSILKQGVEVWNKWREENPDLEIDLSGVDLIGVNLSDANFTKANLRKANLFRADPMSSNLRKADLRGSNLNETELFDANLSEANISRAFLRDANLQSANLARADLRYAHLFRANLSDANLFHADMRNTYLVGTLLLGTQVNKSKISGSWIYGISVWDLKGEFEEQKDLVIINDFLYTPEKTPTITVDNVKVAQFIYLILNNQEIRDVINTLTSKTVLILGRFADDERKAILNALRNKLREYNLLPIVFDFDRPIDRNITETIKTLAAISYFVIADVTSPKSSPLELQAIVPDFQIPVMPIIQESELPFSMIADLQSQHDGVLDPLTYQSEEMLIKALKPAIIDPAIQKHNELRLIKAREPKIRSASDFIDDKGLD